MGNQTNRDTTNIGQKFDDAIVDVVDLVEKHAAREDVAGYTEALVEEL